MPLPDQTLRQAVIDAALNLAGQSGTHGFTIPVPNTSPQLFVSLHEGEVQLRTAEGPTDAQIGKLLNAGAQLSNLAFNLAQRENEPLPARVASSLREVCSSWDRAHQEYRAAMRTTGGK